MVIVGANYVTNHGSGTPGHYNAGVRIDCSAPTRIDLAGGTFDIWPLYLFHDQAQTINAALSLRARSVRPAKRCAPAARPVPAHTAEMSLR